jgi:hypothetical protein
MKHGLHPVGTSTAGDIVKKIPVQFLKFCLHYVTVQLVYAKSNGPCIFVETNSDHEIKLTVTSLIRK